MKMCYATQVLSHSMASTISLLVRSGDLDEGALETAKNIKFFDKLFDSVNGDTLCPRWGKPLSGGVYRNSGHTKFWQESIQSLSNKYFIVKNMKKMIPPTLKNWIKTVE